ncbi:cytochrome b pre-mRNA-processing protein 3 [Rhodothalassium salexigens DSM 2132]|uniref:Cytochrome b pre-mRNA-processing protein 3 n=1 Tax=Rhodothalassium salexigens DSM 2132 TaxID=1188247 RepID=A0A4R2PQP5_RHOSA|nr:ubiquinol-cytochrome C chaperone family protein [Rhodothalassium salexigens]MBB4209978.1 cytochrome b pre-mRNA-processing protein 3 [Rhodothalassium salexigens DSM 2132]TCP38143.1 cytochrome b pre-mRNA-processing protein 3 [Rhodothalassium salexigens DSM 2132]
MFSRWRQNRTRREQAKRLYDRAVAAARRPVFYDVFGVPDTVDGRFDALILHVFALIHSLDGRDEPAAAELQQRVQECMVVDFDRSLREAGVGDLSVGKKIKSMAQAFGGRFEGYRAALIGDRDLAEAVARNLFGVETIDDAPHAKAMADYLCQAIDHLAAEPVERFEADRITFPSPRAETAA